MAKSLHSVCMGVDNFMFSFVKMNLFWVKVME